MSDATASIMSTHPEHQQTWMMKEGDSVRETAGFSVGEDIVRN